MFLLLKFLSVMVMAAWAFGIGEFYMDGQNYSLAPFEKMCEGQRSFVIDAWKVPKSWINPSMVLSPDDPNKVVIVWRMPDKGRHDKIGYMWLNRSSWEAIKGYDMIEIIKPGMWRTYLLGEDARIFNHFGKTHIVYNNHLTRFKRLYYAELWYNVKEDMFHALDPTNHVIFENEINIRHQKNWSPFDFCPRCAFRGGSAYPSNATSDNATLLFVYGIQPHTIVLAYNTSKVGEMTAKVVFKTSVIDPDLWQWGEMRGGTPALLVGDSYLAFFHSSGRLSHKHVITYVMGAYLFSREPPFAITHVSPEPIFHQTFINESYGWAYKVIDYIVFPMGFIFDDDFIYVSYGKNDKDGWILKLNRTGFFNSLRPVQSKVIGRSDWDRRTGDIWKPKGLISSTVLASTKHARCEVHKMKTEKGQIKSNWIWLEELSHVCILAHLKVENKYLLFYQSKYALDAKSYAPLGGYFDPGESASDCARRELLEEAGLESEELLFMGKYRAKGNRGGGFAYFFLARNSFRSNRTRAISDDSENQEVALFSLPELVQLVKSRKILVSPWLAAIALGALMELDRQNDQLKPNKLL